MNEERQVTIRQPLSRIRWQQVRLFGIVITEALQVGPSNSRIIVQYEHSTTKNADGNGIPRQSSQQFRSKTDTCSMVNRPPIPTQNSHPGRAGIRLSEHDNPEQYAHTLLGLGGGRPQVQLDGVTPQDGEARLVVKQGEAELVAVERHAPLQVAHRQGRYGVQHPQAPPLPREPVDFAILPGPRDGPMGRASQAQQESLVTSWVNACAASFSPSAHVR